MTHFVNHSGPSTNYIYPNGDEVYLACEVFVCRDYSGELKVQEDEVVTQRFFAYDELPDNLDPLGGDNIRMAIEMARKKLI